MLNGILKSSLVLISYYSELKEYFIVHSKYVDINLKIIQSKLKMCSASTISYKLLWFTFFLKNATISLTELEESATILSSPSLICNSEPLNLINIVALVNDNSGTWAFSSFDPFIF